MKFQSPKGTRDFYPADMAAENYIFDRWRQAARLFGFEEYEGPIFEHLELFTAKSGDEIVHQLYTFKDKGGRDLALRPELTPALARMINQSGGSLRYPLRWFSIPRCFRYERMQKGRLREFFQLNLDIVGSSSTAADAELMTAVAHMMQSFGLSENDFSIRISSRKLLQSALQSIGIDSGAYAKVLYTLDRQDKVKPDEYQQMLTETGLNASQIECIARVQSAASLQAFGDLFPKMDRSELTELDALFAQLSAAGIENCAAFDPKVVRGLAYYTGIVFEVFFKGEKMRAIAGGGRYDHLMESLGGRSCPATGFGIGDVVLADVLRAKGLLPEHKRDLDAFVAAIGPVARLYAPRMSAVLRKEGISAIFSFEDEGLSKQMRRAVDANARCVLILGEEEMAQHTVGIKNLSTGEQNTIPQIDAARHVLNLRCGSSA